MQIVNVALSQVKYLYLKLRMTHILAEGFLLVHNPSATYTHL